MKTLHLNLKAKWYDMIKSGIKKEEYREIKPFWEKRLFEKFQHIDENGRLYLWIVKPIRHKDCWRLPEQYGTHISSYYMKIDSSLFPEVTWETDPRKIELNLL